MDKLNNKERLNSLDYINSIFSEFIETSGDRVYGDDQSIICGIASLDKFKVSIIGQIRGRDIGENVKHNFSMGYPEGYRKAIKTMRQAEKFKRPVICFVDTIGAYPGLQAEERGQANSLANCMLEMMFLNVPVISILIGHGGSGGALALCASNDLVAIESAVLSVISPKACASILWKDSSRGEEAFELLKMTSTELHNAGIIDKILYEPNDDIHTNPIDMANEIKNYLILKLKKYQKLSNKRVLNQRLKKYRNMRKTTYTDFRGGFENEQI
jgi:acetyl-CoA carboxylase carboxyl transferase alpha subunit